MAVFNIIPNQFSDIDLRDTLNANGGRVPGNPGISIDFFNEKANINKWSNLKPTWNESYPSSFAVDRIVGTIHYLKYQKPTPPYRIKDYVGYNTKASSCRLNRISVSPTTVSMSGQGITVFFEWFTGEIDWRVYGATTLRFYLTVDGNIVSGQEKEVLLNNVPVNGIINNSGQEVFQYNFVGVPGNKRVLGVGVSMRDNDGRLFIIDEPEAVISLSQTVEYKVNYPTNIVYNYTGKWQTYYYYIASMPELPINSNTGQLYQDLQIPFNGKDNSILTRFKGGVYFQLPNGRTVTYNYTGETPDQAATKVLMYSISGGTNILWDPITDPYYVTVPG